MPSSSTPKPEADDGPRRSSGRLRPVLFRLIAVVGVPAFVLLAAEGLVRVAGLGWPTRLSVPAEVDGQPRRVDNPAFTWPDLGPRRARRCPPFALQVPPPEDACRIFVLGGSAAQGDPDPTYSFARALDVLLAAWLPDERIEVVNVAMTAINSHTVRPIAHGCLDLDADLLVVYMGHNEVVGPYGIDAASGALSPTYRSRFRRSLLSFRTAQLMQRIVWERRARRGELGDWQGMETYLDRRVRADDAGLDRVHRAFRDNLTSILDEAGAAGVPVVLCTVPSNLRDCPPFASAHREGIPAVDHRRLTTLARVAQRRERANDPEGALAALNEALKIDPGHAETLFRKGLALLALGRPEPAGEAFVAARDADGLRFRADSDLQHIIRETAARRNGAPVVLADLERRFAAVSPAGSPGLDLFYEHVHLNPVGAHLVARTVLEVLHAAQPVALFDRPLPDELPGPMACARRLGLTGWGMLQIVAQLHDRMSRAPFTEQLAHDAMLGRIATELRTLRAFGEGRGLEQSRRQLEAAVQRRPDDAILRYNLGLLLHQAGDLEHAADQLAAVVAVRPTFDECRRQLTRVLLDDDRPARAVPHLERLTEHHPYTPDVVALLGAAHLAAGDFRTAQRSLERAKTLDPHDPDTLYHLALTHLGSPDEEPSSNERETARGLLETALELDPQHDDARRVLESLER